MRHWMFSCKKISGMISESMDRDLSVYKRMGIRFHLMMCSLCRRYQKQLFFIRSVLQQSDDVENSSSQSLSLDARKRIEKEVNDKCNYKQN
jgi:hypothetical protein